VRPIPFTAFLRRSGLNSERPRFFAQSAALRRFARIRTEMSNDELLAQLNGRVIDRAGNPRRIDVYSIVDEGTHRWIQVGLQGSDCRTALLKLAYLADDGDAVSALEDWLRESGTRHGTVLTVTPSL
jgi:hypothetical protein